MPTRRKQGLARFTSCVLQSGIELPYRAIKTNIADSLNVIVQVERRPGRRYISEVLLINGYDPDTDLFDYGAVFQAKQEQRMNRGDAIHAEIAHGPGYVRALFEPGDNAAILVRNRGTGKTVQRIARAEVIAGPEFQEWLRHKSAAGADVYVGMNPIREGAYSRTKENIKRIRHVYLDLDRNGDASLEAIRNSAEVPAPNFVLDTSPGKHQVVWKVTGFNRDEAEALLRDLSNQFDGDPAATDSTRVLRLPGFAESRNSTKSSSCKHATKAKPIYRPATSPSRKARPKRQASGERQDGPRHARRPQEPIGARLGLRQTCPRPW